MAPDDAPHPHTRLAHAGCVVDPATGAVVASPVFATTFERGADGEYAGGHVYSRTSNPTRALLETTLADLESGAGAACFASGMAASYAVFAALPTGAHVVLPDDVYFNVRRLFDTVLAGRLTYTSADLSQPGALEAAVRPETALVWVETPSNPLLRVTDIAETARVAHAHGARVAVDGTWTTPLLQRPLALGADLVVHSLTKYLAGHSDVLGGAVIAREANGVFETIRAFQGTAGPVLDPFSSWLTLRGMRTLAVRLERACATAEALAVFLDGHGRVAAVHYPGLASHAGHAVARAQMAHAGAMLSFEVDGGEPAARAVANALTVFRQATSLGGTESLVEHRASVEGPDTRSPAGLLRVSVGLEHAGDLVADLERALA